MSVCLYVCMLAGYLKQFKSDLDETWQACRPYDLLEWADYDETW